MTGDNIQVAANIQGEIERGLACALQAHYADAATHFTQARERMHHRQLAAALDAFIESHARYWTAQQALHDATHRFVVADADQQGRLADLRRLLSDAALLMEMPGAEVTTDRSGSDHDHDRQAGWSTGHGDTLPPLSITCLGGFEVWRSGTKVELCHNRHGQMILRYLVAHPRHRETIDTLIEVLWPDEPEISRRKLYVALSALRCSLNDGYACQPGAGYVLCEGGVYQLNPAILIRIDAEEFVAHYQAGRQLEGDAAIAHFEEACRLYRGPFLPEDLYADWSLIQREQLTQIHLTMCHALAAHYVANARYSEAAEWSLTILEENRCDEAAYRQLMYAYAAAGRRNEALRHYQRCQHVLQAELGVQPMPETTALFYAILRGESVPAVS